MAREAGIDPDLWNHTDAFERLAHSAYTAGVADEREACAAILDANADRCVPSSTFMQLLRSNAAAIRARGQGEV